MSVRSEEALYAAVGFGEVMLLLFSNRLTEKERRKKSVRRQSLKLKS